MAGSGSVTARVLRRLGDVRPWQEVFYRNLHEHPELSHQEHDTAAEVARRLRSFGYQVHDSVGGTGVVGVLRNGDGPAVRAERAPLNQVLRRWLALKQSSQ